MLRRSLRADERLLRPSARRAKPQTDAGARAVPVDNAAMLQRIQASATRVNEKVLRSEGSVDVAGQRDAMLAALVPMLLVASTQGRAARQSLAMHWRMPSASVAPVALMVFVVTMRWKCCVVA